MPMPVPEESHATGELYLLEAYLTLCSILTIVLNSLLLFLLSTKVKISRCPACIPVVPMSILGLIYGLSSLLITVSFYGRNILVEESLCNGLAIVQSHVASAYVVNICSIAVEAAWAMSHRFTYQPTSSIVYLILSGVVSIIIPAPLSAVHLIQVQSDEEVSTRFYYNSRLKQCVMYWGTGTTASLFYISYTVMLSLTYLVCLKTCWIVVQVYVSKSKTEFHGTTFQDSKARKRAQDVSIAKSAMVLTLGGVLPWVPTVPASVLLAVVGDEAHAEPHLLYEVAVWSTHSLFWVFPVLCLFKNTAVRRALHCLKMDLAKLVRRARS